MVWLPIVMNLNVRTAMYAIVHGGCTDTVRESELETDSEKNPLLHRRLEPALVLHLALRSCSE